MTRTRHTRIERQESSHCERKITFETDAAQKANEATTYTHQTEEK